MNRCSLIVFASLMLLSTTVLGSGVDRAELFLSVEVHDGVTGELDNALTRSAEKSAWFNDFRELLRSVLDDHGIEPIQQRFDDYLDLLPTGVVVCSYCGPCRVVGHQGEDGKFTYTHFYHMVVKIN